MPSPVHPMSDETAKARELHKARVAKVPLPHKLNRFKQKIMWRWFSDRAYGRGIESLAHAYVVIGAEHPEWLELNFVQSFSADEQMWEEFCRRWPDGDKRLGGMSGASANRAYNIARLIVLGLQPSEVANQMKGEKEDE